MKEPDLVSPYPSMYIELQISPTESITAHLSELSMFKSLFVLDNDLQNPYSPTKLK
jgi:hypothetical protein